MIDEKNINVRELELKIKADECIKHITYDFARLNDIVNNLYNNDKTDKYFGIMQVMNNINGLITKLHCSELDYLYTVADIYKAIFDENKLKEKIE